VIFFLGIYFYVEKASVTTSSSERCFYPLEKEIYYYCIYCQS
jgi:hypothetical protein